MEFNVHFQQSSAIVRFPVQEQQPGTHYLLITARIELRKVLFLALSVTFLFVYEISPEPADGFAPNSRGRRVWSLDRKSLDVKVKGQRSRSPGTKTGFSADISVPLNGLATNSHGISSPLIASLCPSLASTSVVYHSLSSFPSLPSPPNN